MLLMCNATTLKKGKLSLAIAGQDGLFTRVLCSNVTFTGYLHPAAISHSVALSLTLMSKPVLSLFQQYHNQGSDSFVGRCLGWDSNSLPSRYEASAVTYSAILPIGRDGRVVRTPIGDVSSCRMGHGSDRLAVTASTPCLGRHRLD